MNWKREVGGKRYMDWNLEGITSHHYHRLTASFISTSIIVEKKYWQKYNIYYVEIEDTRLKQFSALGRQRVRTSTYFFSSTTGILWQLKISNLVSTSLSSSRALFCMKENGLYSLLCIFVMLSLLLLQLPYIYICKKYTILYSFWELKK